jgi:glutathione reductase (NADPH)
VVEALTALTTRGVPGVVFTIPPLARVGLSEDEAREQTGDLRVKCELTFNWFTAKYRGEPCAGFKTLVDGANDHILSVHLMKPGAEEVINLFALAIQNDVPASRLKQVVLASPTAGYDIRSML